MYRCTMDGALLVTKLLAHLVSPLLISLGYELTAVPRYGRVSTEAPLPSTGKSSSKACLTVIAVVVVRRGLVAVTPCRDPTTNRRCLF